MYKTNARNICSTIKGLKLGYTGYVARENELKWNSLLTFWISHDRKRRRGRPNTRWIDKLSKIFGATWQHEACNRQQRRRARETYAQKCGRLNLLDTHLPTEHNRMYFIFDDPGNKNR